jgi:hypothetical protein
MQRPCTHGALTPVLASASGPRQAAGGADRGWRPPGGWGRVGWALCGHGYHSHPPSRCGLSRQKQPPPTIMKDVSRSPISAHSHSLPHNDLLDFSPEACNNTWWIPAAKQLLPLMVTGAYSPASVRIQLSPTPELEGGSSFPEFSHFAASSRPVSRGKWGDSSFLGGGT